MIYLLSVLVNGQVRRPPHGPNKYNAFTTMKAEGEGWDPVKASLRPTVIHY